MEQLDERRPSVPLRVKAPTSSIVAVWRAPLWQRILFPAVGLAMIAGAFWPEAGKSYEPLWVGVEVVVGAMLVLYALRPKLTLFKDAVYIRGQFLSRLISIEEIAAVEGGYGGLGIWWGDGHFSEASSIGEQTNIDGLPGSDGRRHAIRTLILTTRDAYLERHDLVAPTRPSRRGRWSTQRVQGARLGEHNPPPTGESNSGDGD